MATSQARNQVESMNELPQKESYPEVGKVVE